MKWSICKNQFDLDDEFVDIVAKIREKSDLKARNNPEFAEVLAKELSQQNPIICTVEEVKKAIFNRPVSPDKATFSFIPTEMTRLSPFFPISKSEKGKPEYKEVTWENSWGRMYMKGIKLSIYDEYVLLALCRLFRQRQTLTMTVSRTDICNAIGKGRGKNTLAAIDKAIERLTGTLVTIEVWDNIKTRIAKMKMGNTILTGYTISETGKITVTLNPYFKEAYLETMVTSIDVDFRMSLKHDISKSLQRFLEAQPQDYQIGMDKLIVAINVNADQERKHIRAILRTGLDELKEKNYLEFFNIGKDNIITIRKAKTKHLVK